MLRNTKRWKQIQDLVQLKEREDLFAHMKKKTCLQLKAKDYSQVKRNKDLLINLLNNPMGVH